MRSHRTDGYWLDIGRVDDYERAQEDFDPCAPSSWARMPRDRTPGPDHRCGRFPGRRGVAGVRQSLAGRRGHCQSTGRADSARADAACDLGDAMPHRPARGRFAPDVVLPHGRLHRHATGLTLFAANVLRSPTCSTPSPSSAPTAAWSSPARPPSTASGAPTRPHLAETHELPSVAVRRLQGVADDACRNYCGRGLDRDGRPHLQPLGRDAPEHFVLGAVAAQLREHRAGSSRAGLRLGDLTRREGLRRRRRRVCRAARDRAEGRAGEVYNICSASRASSARVANSCGSRASTSRCSLTPLARPRKCVVERGQQLQASRRDRLAARDPLQRESLSDVGGLSRERSADLCLCVARPPCPTYEQGSE